MSDLESNHTVSTAWRQAGALAGCAKKRVHYRRMVLTRALLSKKSHPNTIRYNGLCRGKTINVETKI